MARSQAYVDFRAALQLADSLLTLERRVSKDPPPLAKQGLVRALRGGSAVLMVAAFEVFLDDLVSAAVQFAVDRQAKLEFEKLPRRMQEWNVFQTLKLALDGPQYQRAGPRYLRIPAIRIASEQIARLELIPNAFGGTAGNPDKAAVRKLFRRIGIDDVFAFTAQRFARKWGQPVPATFIADTLNEVVARRHRVAHRADALGIARSDLATSTRFLRIFAEVLDIDAGRHIRAACRAAAR